jgi:hypothetical protein
MKLYKYRVCISYKETIYTIEVFAESAEKAEDDVRQKLEMQNDEHALWLIEATDY